MSARISRQPLESGAQERPRARTSADVSSLTAAGAELGDTPSAPAGFVGGEGRPARTVWTPERVKELRRLAAKGWSDAQMGAHFGGMDRTAILSARRRYDITAGRPPGSRVTNASRRGGKATATVAKAAKEKVAKPKVAKAAKKPSKKPAPPKAALVAAPVVAPVATPVARVAPLPEPPVEGGVPMIDLGAGACRWPIGRDALGRHAFCGAAAAEGRPYCAGHHARAVKPRAEQPS